MTTGTIAFWHEYPRVVAKIIIILFLTKYAIHPPGLLLTVRMLTVIILIKFAIAMRAAVAGSRGIVMQTDFESQFNQIERLRTALEQTVFALNDAQLRRKPAPCAWSITQAIHHLVLSDEIVGHAYETRTMPSEPVLLRVVPGTWRHGMVVNALRRGSVLPVPSSDFEPRGEVAFPELLSRWEAARREMHSGLDAMRGDAARYFRPIIGPLSAARMLELAEAHIAYHARQIEMLRNNAALAPALSKTKP